MRNFCDNYESGDIQILQHHIYEYKKGLRNLVLHTMNKEEQGVAESLLNKKGIQFIIQDVTIHKINIFFGKDQCIKIIRSFGNKSLNDFTDEQDFILGIMLGYDRTLQCERYIKRKGLGSEIKEVAFCLNSN